MGASSLDREAFFERLQDFEEGFVIGNIGGCRIWLQLLTALYLEAETYEGDQGPRLLLGEAFVQPAITPRNAVIIPWHEITAIDDSEGAITIKLTGGELQILSRAAVELAGEVVTGKVERQSTGASEDR